MTMKYPIFIVTASVLCVTALNSPPQIMKQPPTDELLFQVARTGANENKKPFIIECEAEGEPRPEYSWVKNGKPFEFAVYGDRMSQQPGRGTLVIAQPQEEDLGQYQCFAKNEFGIATSNSVFVRKAELNSFKDGLPITLAAKEGEPFKLACQPPDGWPKPQVHWIKQSPNYDGFLKSINNSRMTLDPEGNLWFSNVTQADVSDEYYYACTASAPNRNEYKIGNKIMLQVTSAGSSEGHNKQEPVEQYVSRKNSVALRGKEIKLYCIFGGTPLPETVWSKNGQPITMSEHITQDDYGKSLKIKNVNFDDEGLYTCVVTNGVGQPKTHSIDLNVEAVPYFTLEPEIVKASEDETATFTCEASGDPKPEIKWIHNGKPLSEAPTNSRRRVTSNSIIIEKLTKQDTGNYGCNATNYLGYVYKDVYLNVLTLPPEFREGPTDKSTVDGKNVTLTCRVDAAPKPKIKWLRNGLELTGGRYRTLDNGDLEINAVSFTDIGRYICHASNKFGEAQMNGTLMVKEHTRITHAPEDYEVKAGDTATFRCNAVKDPSLDLEIRWQRNGEYINVELDPRFVMLSDSSLSITKTIELDTGIYTCIAQTKLDEARAQATLTVQDAPNPPKLESTKCGRNDADITWSPRGDNRSPILYYTIQFNTSFTPDSWEIVENNVPATEQTYKIKMTPWANYTYRVIAWNSVGPSTPSPHSIVCTTMPDVPYKNPSNVMGNGTDPQNMVIRWTIMPQVEHHAPRFAYRISWRLDTPDAPWRHEEVNDWRTNYYKIDGLPTYQRYQIKVAAINEKGASKMVPDVVYGFSGEDQPTQAPGNFTVQEVSSSTSAILSWTAVPPESVRGELKGYKIQTWTEEEGEAGIREIAVPGANTTRAVINKFTPYSKNYVKILAYNGRYNGPPSETLSFNTPEGVPGPVLSLDAYPMGSSALYIKWTKPDKPNGVLNGYRIYYQLVNGTALDTMLERPRITDPEVTSAKIAKLASNSKYRVYVRATTKAGEGVDFYIEESTRHAQKPDVPKFTWQTIPKENGYVTVKVTWLPEYSGYPGSHFFAKYMHQGETIPLFTDPALYSNELEIAGLSSAEIYIVSIVAVDGDYMTESEPQEVETSSEGPIIQPKENVTAGWFIGMMLAMAFLLMVLIIVCVVKRNRGGKYAVHEREMAAGRGDFDEGGFHEYSQPLDTKSTGGRASFASSSHQDGKHAESDTDSMAEYGEGDTEGMNEDGSFIGQYGGQRKQEPNSQAFATLV